MFKFKKESCDICGRQTKVAIYIFPIKTCEVCTDIIDTLTYCSQINGYGIGKKQSDKTLKIEHVDKPKPDELKEIKEMRGKPISQEDINFMLWELEHEKEDNKGE